MRFELSWLSSAVGNRCDRPTPCSFFIQKLESRAGWVNQHWKGSAAQYISTKLVLALEATYQVGKPQLIKEAHASIQRWRRSRELVCHIDYLLLMRAKIARNASSSIDGTDIALFLLHPEHVFLWNIHLCFQIIFPSYDLCMNWTLLAYYDVRGICLAHMHRVHTGVGLLL